MLQQRVNHPPQRGYGDTCSYARTIKHTLATHAFLIYASTNPAASVFCTCPVPLPFCALFVPPPPPLELSGRWDIKCWEVSSSRHQKDASRVSHPHRAPDRCPANTSAEWLCIKRAEWKTGRDWSQWNVIKVHSALMFHSRASGRYSHYPQMSFHSLYV